MITESFLNSCFSISINDNINDNQDLTIYRDISEILNFYEDQITLEIPIIIQNKYELIKQICIMKLTGKEVENSLDSLLYTKKYAHLHDFIQHKKNEKLKDNVVSDIINQIRLRKKINSLLSNYDDLNNFIDTINDGTFDSMDDMITKYETIIKTLYANMTKSNRGIAIKSSSSLDLEKDDYNNVLNLILKKYEKINTTKTGFDILDNVVFNGGFEPSRLYIFGGGSGSGKSTILNNFIINAATTKKESEIVSVDEIIKKDKPNKKNKNVFVYITCENTIEESLLRTYQPLFKKTMRNVIEDIKNGIDIKQKIVEKLDNVNSTIIMKYFPAMSISTIDIMTVLDDIINEYGQESIKGLYIDYLDLLCSDIKYDIYRMELGHITLSLKTLAVEYNIPVITATQLGRSAYNTEEARELNLNLISESIKKVEHADCIVLLIKDISDDTIVHAKIGKNRSGKSDFTLEFKVDFNYFKFISATQQTNNNKGTSTYNNSNNSNNRNSNKSMISL